MKLTLDKTWKLTLEMWKWIAERIKEGFKENVCALKEMWITNNGFGKENLYFNCFFCEHTLKNEGYLNCRKCPGALVDKTFHCENYPDYEWSEEPVAFYEKLVSLNKRRLARKRKCAKKKTKK